MLVSDPALGSIGAFLAVTALLCLPALQHKAAPQPCTAGTPGHLPGGTGLGFLRGITLGGERMEDPGAL